MTATDRTNLHASCVSVDGRAVIILGASGSGKSSLALQCLALGASLVADDRTWVEWNGHQVMASAPDQIIGMIEARGVGILAAPPADPTPVALVVDLDQAEADRLPPYRETSLLGHRVPLLHRVDAPHFPAAILQHLKHGRKA